MKKEGLIRKLKDSGSGLGIEVYLYSREYCELEEVTEVKINEKKMHETTQKHLGQIKSVFTQ